MTTSPKSVYLETVPNPWWLRATIWLGPPATVLGAISVARSETGISRVIEVTLLLTLGVCLALLGTWLAALRIDVSRAALRYGWGPLGTARRWSDVVDSEVEPYRWLTYGGWGLRFATGKRRAYSVPGVRFGVAVRTTDGKRTHLASRNPEALCAAIRSMVEAASDGARGGHE
ncbi:MAG: hypothetical protein EPO65_11975 [Dehalococcoidia bacterium]|nr:MAG: hypothetical protein EPO65_11975 [Dehalococcoidia bacterium]